MSRDIPSPLIALVAEIFKDHCSHSELDVLFLRANAPGEPPDDTKINKITKWLFRCNADPDIDALDVFGKLIENYMEHELPREEPMDVATWGLVGAYFNSHSSRWKDNRERIQQALGKHSLAYFTGGIIRKSGTTGPSLSLNDILKEKNIPAIDDEFGRTVSNIENDPPAALTGACAIVEALCKVYIEDNGLSMPKKQTISKLWEVVKQHLGLDPKVVADQDLIKIIQGASSIVEGLGALRTHEGSAHGRGNTRYNLKPRHVRLAVNAAHTLVTFIIETWKDK